jgi:SET domain-containing protein
MQIGRDTYLVEDPHRPSVDDFLNHSCRPNLGFVDGSLMLYALCDIQAGDELTFDYSTSMDEPGWMIRCRCRAPNCRGAVRSYSELPKRDRKRLRSITLAYLR